MKHWRRTFGAPIFKLALSCSVGLLVALAAAVDYRALDERLSATADPVASAQILRSVRDEVDSTLQQEIDELPDKVDSSQIENIKWEIAKRAMSESAADDGTGTQTAHDIKNSPLYHDEGDKEQSNWLGNAFSRLNNLFNRKSDRDPSAVNGYRPELGTGGGIGILTPVVWGILGLAIAAFLYFALRNVSFRKGLKRKRKTVLDEDEPERSLDEWLAQADELVAQGKYREAVRALYLACLLKFDEKRVARFIRAETNWEHLARIQASATLPPGLDFRPATQAFDNIWYGKRVKGLEDVDRFRCWYGEVKSRLEKPK